MEVEIPFFKKTKNNTGDLAEQATDCKEWAIVAVVNAPFLRLGSVPYLRQFTILPLRGFGIATSKERDSRGREGLDFRTVGRIGGAVAQANSSKIRWTSDVVLFVDSRWMRAVAGRIPLTEKGTPTLRFPRAGD